MADRESLLVLKARWVFPVSGPPIADGYLTISGPCIVAVGENVPDCPARDLGNAAILAGLVNAHTHLEFSDLTSPIGRPGMPLPDWIGLVLARRSAASGTGSPAVAQGLRESLAAGTVAVGEIATSDWRADRRPAAELHSNVVVFHESIAPVRDRVAGAARAAEAFLLSEPTLPVAVEPSGTGRSLGRRSVSARDSRTAGQASSGTPAAEEFLLSEPTFEQIRPALGPHAPYTVHPELLAKLVELGRRFQVPLAMHLAESREEIELLRAGSGPFRELLQRLQSWDPRADARYPRVGDYLAQLAQAPRALVIHGNYLDRADLDFLADHSETMAVVHCPRTHHFFGHSPYPLARMLAMNISMALGTDSRASNPDLSLFDEMRFVAQNHRQVKPSKILELGTIAGARALGLDQQIGTLEPGKLANFVVVQLGGDESEDPHELLFAPSTRVVQTWLRGQIVQPVVIS